MQTHAELKVLYIITNKHTQKKNAIYTQYRSKGNVNAFSRILILQYLRKLEDKLVEHVEDCLTVHLA